MVTSSERRSRPWYLWLAALAAVAVLILVAVRAWTTFTSAPSSSTVVAAVPGDATQSNDGGQVTVSVTWNGASSGPVFQVALNTHAVPLDSIDLTQLAALRVDGGNAIPPIGWDAPKGGHHHSGTLTFPATASDGKSLISSDTRQIELTIRDVAGVPKRVFVWKP